MAIILEGFDNSGKSTLAASLGLHVVHPGPRPRNDEETLVCLETQLMMCNMSVVMDRVTAISQPCYAMVPDFDRYRRYIERMVNTPYCIIVYCRPPIEVIKNFSNHVVKDYDDEDKVKWLEANADRIVSNYDELMSKTPHFKYDYTKPNMGIIDLAKEAQNDWRAWQYARDNLL